MAGLIVPDGQKQMRGDVYMPQNENEGRITGSEYIVVKALENGVTVIGVTRGAENKFLHTEKLDEGEVWIAQFTEHISAMKIRGSAAILTKHGEIKSGR